MPMILAITALTAASVAFAGWTWRRRRQAAHEAIREHAFAASQRRALRQVYPQLDEDAAAQVEAGLRQYFAAALDARGRPLAMPSNAVDALWHAFILDTRRYETFCQRAFGRLLHHQPAGSEVASAEAAAWRTSLGRTWWHACRVEGIDPHQPARLPLLFALDATLGIPDGQRHPLDGARYGFPPRRADTAGGCTGLAFDTSGGHGGDAGACGDGGGGGGCGGCSD